MICFIVSLTQFPGSEGLPGTQRTASRSLRLPPSSCEAGSERLSPPSSSPDNVLISPDIVTRVSSVRARDQQTARGNRRSPGGSKLYIRMTADLLTNETPKFYDVTCLVLSYTFAEKFFLICLKTLMMIYCSM